MSSRSIYRRDKPDKMKSISPSHALIFNAIIDTFQIIRTI